MPQINEKISIYELKVFMYEINKIFKNYCWIQQQKKCYQMQMAGTKTAGIDLIKNQV